MTRKKIIVTVGSFIDIDGDRRYCHGYECAEIPRPKNMRIPKTFKVTREIIKAVAEQTGMTDLNNIYIERINGEPLPYPTGLTKRLRWDNARMVAD